jgi:hypothetical protein
MRMEKHEYMKKIEAQLTEYNAKLAELRDRVLQVQTDIRREYLNQVKILEGKRGNLRETYGQFKEAGVSAWEDTKEGTEKALADFKEAFDKAINRFKF